MARDILSEYGPESPMNQKPRATSGGFTSARDVMNYSPPQGPQGINNRSVGLKGVNWGNCGTQGTHSCPTESSGSPGLGGRNKGMGTNRG